MDLVQWADMYLVGRRARARARKAEKEAKEAPMLGSLMVTKGK